MARIPTVTILDSRFAGGVLVINASDYDPKVHQRAEADAPAPEAPAAPTAAETSEANAQAEAGDPEASDEPGVGAPDDLAALLKGKVAAVVEAIRTINDPTQLAALLDIETATTARKSVVEAIGLRQAALSEG